MYEEYSRAFYVGVSPRDYSQINLSANYWTYKKTVGVRRRAGETISFLIQSW